MLCGRLRHIFLFCILCAVSIIGTADFSYAESEDSVPIPPRRPAVLNVSPAYIEYLRERDAGIKTSKSDTEEVAAQLNPQDLNDITPSASSNSKTTPLSPKHFMINDGEVTEIADMDKSDILNIISPMTFAAPPKPSYTEISEEVNTTLVSFVMKPEQIHLSKDLEVFLKDHVVRLFFADKNLNMEIQAYAKPIDGEKYSDVRLSLARSLEVRRFLIEHNVAANRMKLSPMGKDRVINKSDRIDLIIFSAN